MSIVYIRVIPGSDKLPTGTRGHRLRKDPKRSRVDFGSKGTWLVPNSWLSETKPDMVHAKLMSKAFGLASAALTAVKAREGSEGGLTCS